MGKTPITLEIMTSETVATLSVITTESDNRPDAAPPGEDSRTKPGLDARRARVGS